MTVIDDRNSPNPQRRKVLTGLAAGAGSLALSACGGGSISLGPPSSGSTSAIASGVVDTTDASGRFSLPRPALPAPAQSGIDHVVLVCMENRSFDHMMSWVPNAEGMPAGRSYTDAFGAAHAPFALASNPAFGYQNCAWADPDHSFSGGRTHLESGQMNGFLLTPNTNATNGDLLPIGYYQAADLPFYTGVAAQYTICDYYFSGILADTYPNRLYLHSGETDRLDDSISTSSLPTIWDLLSAANVGCNYYYSDVPLTALYGTKYLGISHLISDFFSNASAGTLPPFCMVDPRFGEEAQGLSNDDHPYADIRNGQAFLNQVYQALAASPSWGNTLMIVVYDECGGFLEHVVPQTRIISTAEQQAGNDGLMGFRVPCMLLGPRAPKGVVSRYPFDPSSIHALLAWRFGLGPLGVRGGDPNTFNLAYALDFSNAARTDTPAISVPVGPFGAECTAAPASGGTGLASGPVINSQVAPPGGRFSDLRAKATSLGFS